MHSPEGKTAFNDNDILAPIFNALINGPHSISGRIPCLM